MALYFQKPQGSAKKTIVGTENEWKAKSQLPIIALGYADLEKRAIWDWAVVRREPSTLEVNNDDV